MMKKAMAILAAFGLGLAAVFSLAGNYGIRGGHEREGMILVAASDASAAVRASADYVCDGTADEVQINAAIDALTAESRTVAGCSGGTIQLSAGSFSLAATIGLPHQVSLVGEGVYATWVKIANDANCPAITLESGANKGFQRIAHMYIDCNKAGGGNATYGIYENSNIAYDVKIHNLFIADASKNGIYLATGAWGHHYSALVVEFCNESGILIAAGAAPHLVNCKILENNHGRALEGASIEYQGTTALRLSNCELQSADYTTPSYAVHCNGILLMSNCTITTGSSGGQYAYGVRCMNWASIQNCYFIGGEYLLRMRAGADGSIINGNSFYDVLGNNGTGIWCFQQNAIISNNRFFDLAVGIKWFAGATNTQVTGNIFDQCTNAIELGDFPGCRFDNNLFLGNTTDWAGTPQSNQSYGAGNSHPYVQIQGKAAGVAAYYDGLTLEATLTLTAANDLDFADGADKSVSVKIADLANGVYLVSGAYLDITDSDSNGLAVGGAETYAVSVGTVSATNAASFDLTDPAGENDIIASTTMDTDDDSTGPAGPSNATPALLTVSSGGVYLNVGVADAVTSAAAQIAITGTLRVMLKRVK